MKYKLGDICELITGFPFKSKDFVDNGAASVIKITHINPDGIKNDSLSRVDESKYDEDKLKKYLIKAGDYVLAMTGAIGRVGRLLTGEAYINQRVMTFRVKEAICDKDFLFYVLCSKDFYNYAISHVDSATAQPNIGTVTLSKYELDLPDLETQKKIVRILSALDQKIELNSQKNGTYFNICRSLLNNYLSAEDLEEHGLSEFLDVFTGKRNANETSPDGKYIFFSCAPEPLKADTYIYDGSAIIIAGNGAYTGRTRFYEGKMELYQRTYACTPKNNDIQPLIYGFYVYMKNKFEQEKMGGTHGSAIPYIVIGDITKYKILYDKERFEKFSTQVKPFIKAVQENENESIILANLRNSLLPKLMSGEINMEKALTNE